MEYACMYRMGAGINKSRNGPSNGARKLISQFRVRMYIRDVDLPIRRKEPAQLEGIG